MQADSRHRHVKDLEVVLGSDTAVLIVDDTLGVWGHHQRNVLQVLPNPLLLDTYSDSVIIWPFAWQM